MSTPLQRVEQWRDNALDLTALDDSERLAIAEQAVALGEEELVAALESHLNEACSQFVAYRRAQANNDADSAMSAIQSCVKCCRKRSERNQLLEARARMEWGLLRYALGEKEEAGVDLKWAMERLKVLDEGSAAHGVALLNMAAWHESRTEWMMAMAMHSEISRHGPHLMETVAMSRLSSARISMQLTDHESALRHSWVALHGLLEAGLGQLSVEAGLIWLNLAVAEVTETAQRMHQRVEESKPREAGEEFTLNSHPEDVRYVFDLLVEEWDGNAEGDYRPDLQLLLDVARALESPTFEARLRDAEGIADPALVTMLGSE